MRKYIALGLRLGADTLEIIRGGLLAAAVALLGDPMPPYEDEEAYHAWYTRRFS
jgi:hypothetical protein